MCVSDKAFSLPFGAPELLEPLLSLSALTSPLFSSPADDPNKLTSSDIEQFLQELTRRFDGDELEGVLGPVIKGLLFHESLFRPEGLTNRDAGWRGVVGAMELLVSIRSIAVMITQMPEFNPPEATAPTFETVSLMGPLCRLGIFGREWVSKIPHVPLRSFHDRSQPDIAKTYFSNVEKRSRADIESSFASLRSTLKSLQVLTTFVFLGRNPHIRF